MGVVVFECGLESVGDGVVGAAGEGGGKFEVLDDGLVRCDE